MTLKQCFLPTVKVFIIIKAIVSHTVWIHEALTSFEIHARNTLKSLKLFFTLTRVKYAKELAKKMFKSNLQRREFNSKYLELELGISSYPRDVDPTQRHRVLPKGTP